MSRYQKSILLFLILVVLFELFVIVIGNTIRPHWGLWEDERHFHETIKLFGEEINLDNLKHYEEMSTPLPFIVYALWGRIWGFDLFHLRILSVIIAIFTYLIFHRLLYLLFDSKKVIWASIFLVINPYMVGFSIFIYTDMMAILFLILACLAHVQRRPILLGVSMMLTILSRQYTAFFTIAVILFYSLEYVYMKKTNTIKMLLGGVLSTIPYGLLCILWGGTSPDNKWREVFLGEGFYFHLYALTLYLCLLFIYHIPFIVFYIKVFYSDYKVMLISFIGSIYYLIYPIGPATPEINSGIPHVGLFHRFLRFTLKDDFLVHLVLYVSFFLALPIFIYLLKDCYHRWRHRVFDLPFILDLSILSFLVVMPFSFTVWEKYFLPVMPLIIIRILLINQHTNKLTEPMKY